MSNVRIVSKRISKTSDECDYGKTSDSFFNELANESDKPRNARAIWALLRATGFLQEMLHSRLLSGMTTSGVTLKNITNIIRLLMVLPKNEFSSIKVAALREENVGGFVITLKQNAGVLCLTQRTQRVLMAIGSHCAKLPVQYQPHISYIRTTPDACSKVRLYIPMHPVEWFSEKDILGRPHNAYDVNILRPIPDTRSRLDGQVTVRLADLCGCLDNVGDILNAITVSGFNTFFADAKLLMSDEFFPEYLRVHLGVAGLKRLFETVRMNVLSPERLYTNLTFRLSIFHKENGEDEFVVSVFPSGRISATGSVIVDTGVSTSTFESEYEKFCQNYNLEPTAPWLCFYHTAIIHNPKQDELIMDTKQTKVKPVITYNDECSLYRRFQSKLMAGITTDDGLTKAFYDAFDGCGLVVTFAPAVSVGGGIKSNQRTLCVTFTLSVCSTTLNTLESITGKAIDFFIGKTRAAGERTKTKIKNNASALAYFNLGGGYTCCELVGKSGSSTVFDVGYNLRSASEHFARGMDVDIVVSVYYREWRVGSDDGAQKEFEKMVHERLGDGAWVARANIALFGLHKKDVHELAGRLAARCAQASASLSELFPHTCFKTTDVQNITGGITISSDGSIRNGPAMLVGGMEQYAQYLKKMGTI